MTYTNKQATNYLTDVDFLKKLLHDFLFHLEREADVSQLNTNYSYEGNSDSKDVILATTTLKNSQVTQS